MATGGAVQVVATLAVGVAAQFGQTPARAVFHGFIRAMASAAIALRAPFAGGRIESIPGPLAGRRPDQRRSRPGLDTTTGGCWR